VKLAVGASAAQRIAAAKTNGSTTFNNLGLVNMRRSPAVTPECRLKLVGWWVEGKSSVAEVVHDVLWSQFSRGRHVITRWGLMMLNKLFCCNHSEANAPFRRELI